MYLFVLSPPRHGSTIVYKLLATSPNVSTLFGASSWAGEGQFVHAAKRFFEPDNWRKDVDWAGIKRVWDKSWDLTKPILCEKSPSNICRAMLMERFFRRFGGVYFICLIRSPYARGNVQRWVRLAKMQRRNIRRLNNVFRLRYEDFVGDVSGTINGLLAFIPKLEHLDGNVTWVPGMDLVNDRKRCSKIADHTIPATTSKIAQMRPVLKANQQLLDFFGYKLR